jgi:spermidine/putrescine transport system permease protein
MKPRPLLAPALSWLALWFAAPLLMTVAASFAQRGQPIVWSFSPDAWRSLLDPGVLKVLTRTLSMAALTTLGTLAAGLPTAWLINRSSQRTGRTLLALVMLPLAANSLVLVYSWMSLLARDGLAGRALAALHLVPEGGQWLYSPAASLLGMIYYFLPFMVWPVVSALARTDPKLIEAAADLGAPPRAILRHIILPLVTPGIAAGAILAAGLTVMVPAVAGPVNVNAADARTLQKELVGIGPAKAQAIVAAREKNGPFKSLDEVAKVKGVGKKLVDRNRGNLRLDGKGQVAGNGSASGAAAGGMAPGGATSH